MTRGLQLIEGAHKTTSKTPTCRSGGKFTKSVGAKKLGGEDRPAVQPLFP